MADHHHFARPAGELVGGVDESAEPGLEPEHVEVVGCHNLARHHPRHLPDSKAKARPLAPGKPGQRRHRVSIVSIGGMRDI